MLMKPAEQQKCVNTIIALSTLRGSHNRTRRKLSRAHRIQNGECIWCDNKTFLWWELTNKQYRKLQDNQIATIEHMIAKSAGGNNKQSNITCSCEECNTLRGNISLGSWKYITDNPARFELYKNRKKHSKEMKHEHIQFCRMIKHIKHLNKKYEGLKRLWALAIMFEMCMKYNQVDLPHEFSFRQIIIRNLAKEYGVC